MIFDYVCVMEFSRLATMNQSQKTILSATMNKFKKMSKIDKKI